MSIPLDNNNHSILEHLPNENKKIRERNSIVLPPLRQPTGTSSRILLVDKPICSSSRTPASSDAERDHHHDAEIRTSSVSSGSGGILHGADSRKMPQEDEGKGSLRNIAEKETETETGGGNADDSTATTCTAAELKVPCIVEHNDGNVDAINGTQLSSIRHDTQAGQPEEDGTDHGEHCEFVHSGAVGSTDATSRCSVNNNEGSPTRDACAALVVDAPTNACVSMPTGEAAKLSSDKRGSPSPFSPSSIRARVGGLRNRLTLGWEAPASPSCPPRPASQESANQQHQPLVRGRSPLSWLQLGRSKESGRGKVSPVPTQVSIADDSKTGVDHGVDEAATCGRPSQSLESSGGGHHGRFPRGGDGEDGMLMAGQKEAHVDPAKEQPRPIRGPGDDSNEAGVATKLGTLNEVINDNTDAGVTSTGKVADDNTATVAAGSNFDSKKQDGEANHKVLTRNMTLIDHDVWPAVLNNEADPTEWALDKGESEVLAAARSLGSILVRVVTWNLHAKPTPAAGELRETLLPPGKFHVFAIGTEECQNSIAKSVIVHSKKEWETLLKETLGASYEMLCGHALQATHNAVFAHRAIVPLLRNVRSSAVPTGLSLGAPGTTLGNKGGVGIAFSIGATSCVFVNSHLAAHQTNVRERNEHFFQISHGLVRALRPTGSMPRGSAQRRSVPSSCPTISASSAVATPRDRAADGGGGGGDGGGSGSADETVAICQPIDSSADGNNGESCRAGTQVDLERGVSTPRAPDVAVTITVAGSTATDYTLPSGGPIALQQQPSTEGTSDISELAAKKPHPASLPPEEDDTVGGTPPLSPDPRAAVQHPRCPPSPTSRHGVGSSGGGGGDCHSQGSTSLPAAFDRVIWAGDLNYRINAPRAVADLLLAKDMHEVLLKNEQLTLERKKKGEGGYLPPFSGYREGPLNFRPTYKYDSGTDTYDTSSKQRVPAWTDRVLFSGGAVAQTTTIEGDRETTEGGEAEGRLKLRAYRSIAELRTSDHRPVLASFVMEFDQRTEEGGEESGSEGAAVTNQTSSEVCSLM